MTYVHISPALGIGANVDAGEKIGTMVTDPEPGFHNLHVHVFATTDGKYSGKELTSRMDVTPLLRTAGCQNP